MNKLKKGLIFALISTIVFTLLPHNPFSQVAEANTMELDHPYYGIDAALYEDTAFLLGTELEDEGAEDKLKLVARKGDQTITLISEEEMEISSPYIRFDGTDKLVLEGFSWAHREDVMYTINKATLQVEKKTESEFYSVFFQALENHGYTVDEFNYYNPRYGNEEGPEWVIFEKYNYQNEDGKYIEPPPVMVHKSGKVIVEQFENGNPSIRGNINGEIFYQDFDRNSYVRINPDGTKTEFLLPEELADRYVNLQDKQYRIYIDAPDSSFDVYQLKTDGTAATYITNINVGWYMYENSSGDIWYTKPSEDYYYSTFGYLDEDLKPNDVFSYPYHDFLDMSAHGNHFIVYTHSGYSVLTKQDAAIAPEGWVQVNNKWYFYYKEKGTHKGWLLSGGKWYFMDRTRGEMQKGWATDKAKWYFLDKTTGVMKTGWIQDSGVWYLLNGQGYMETGWKQSGGKWYLLAESGAMLTDWAKSGGSWYYLSDTGSMTQGWLQLGNTWYYLQGSGEMVTGWKEVGGKWYFFYSDGSMAANTTIGGYKLGASGAWVQ